MTTASKTRLNPAMRFAIQEAIFNGMEEQLYYKVVRVKPDGSYTSCVVYDTPWSKEYVLGETTSSPKAPMFLFRRRRRAVVYARDVIGDPVAVLGCRADGILPPGGSWALYLHRLYGEGVTIAPFWEEVLRNGIPRGSDIFHAITIPNNELLACHVTPIGVVWSRRG